MVVADAAKACGARVVRTPVGEAHVARAIREEGALIGGEGNGGVILPALHLGRDAPLGVALVLQYFTTLGRPVSAAVAGAPRYRIVKAKAPRQGDLAAAYARLEARFPEATRDQRDGLRLSWADRWVHLRPSGTEPILRLIAEAPTAKDAEGLIAACRDAL
jgi:phosphomannomutase